jgi:hypothetical protein
MTAKKHVKIDHPIKHTAVASRSFAAYGTASGVARITGLLYNRETKKSYAGDTLREPPDWIVYFLNVPAGKHYTLQIFESPGGLLTHEDISIRTSGRQILVTYPKPGGTLCTSFTAYGTTNDPGSFTGKMTRNKTSAVYVGTPIQPPPNWVIQFTGLPPSTSPTDLYTLTVTVGTSMTTVPNLKVVVC